MYYARSNGHRIAYQLAGNGGSPVVLHSGMFEDGGHWAHLGYTGVLAASGVPVLMYAGTADPWHDPMRDHALAHGARFFSVPDADHGQAPRRSRQVLARVLPFLEERRAA
ncbi:hypothetical protein ACWDA3_55380 [Nonomuraea rubra]